MAESRELGLPKTTISLKEQLARTTLRNLKLQGHTYIELREDGKRFVFFCTLCLAPCYSDTILLGHLNGNLHKERLSCARITLLGPNPWPFSDGVLFFDSSTGEEEKPPISDVPSPLQHCSDDDRLAIVKYDENRTSESHGDNQAAVDTDDVPSHCADNLLISNVLIKERTLDVEAKFIGFGRIAARLFEVKGRSTWIDKIWCEWLGEEGPSDEEKASVPEHDFAIVTFSYFYNLGRLGLLDDASRLLTSGQSAESGNGEDSGRKRKKSFSDPEDTSESLCNQYDSSEEVSSARNSSSSRALTADCDDLVVNKRVIKNRTLRRELRKQQRIFSERICEVCKQKMLPGKDAATILNMKTGKLVCGSRNLLGAFHLFHVSCVIHWFLFCETEILGSKIMCGKGKKRCKKQSGVKSNELNNVSWEIFSVFCPECQGTGINIEGGVIERDTFPLSQTWRFQVKVSEGRKAWVKNPEKLENCSTGFHFPQQEEEAVKGQEERVQSMKLVRFYRVEL
uniref:C2H2-type domain-containing protein n=1 Tax=Noccaea caerulescens TaxID=107243 RepID=A0A1J3K5Q6_NOCCA